MSSILRRERVDRLVAAVLGAAIAILAAVFLVETLTSRPATLVSSAYASDPVGNSATEPDSEEAMGMSGGGGMHPSMTGGGSGGGSGGSGGGSGGSGMSGSGGGSGSGSGGGSSGGGSSGGGSSGGSSGGGPTNGSSAGTSTGTPGGSGASGGSAGAPPTTGTAGGAGNAPAMADDGGAKKNSSQTSSKAMKARISWLQAQGKVRLDAALESLYRGETSDLLDGSLLALRRAASSPGPGACDPAPDPKAAAATAPASPQVPPVAGPAM